MADGTQEGVALELQLHTIGETIANLLRGFSLLEAGPLAAFDALKKNEKILKDAGKATEKIVPATERYAAAASEAADETALWDAATEKMLRDAANPLQSRLAQLDEALDRHQDKLQEIEEQYRKDVAAIRDWLKAIEDLERNAGAFEAAVDLGAGSVSVDFSDVQGLDGLNDFLTQQIIDAFDNADTSVFTDEFGDRMAQAIANAFASGDIKSAIEGVTNLFAAALSDVVSTKLGNALGEGLGASIGAPAIGAIAGGLFQQAIDGFLGAGKAAEEAARKAREAFESLINDVRSSMTSIRREVIDTLDSINELLTKLNEAGRGQSEVTAAIDRELKNIVASITGIAAQDFGARLAAAKELVDTLTRMPAEVLAAFEGLDLGQLANQLTQEFLGVTAAIDLASIRQSADELRSAIRALGLESDQTAKLIKQVQLAERALIQERMAGALNNLVTLMEQAGIRSAEAARLRAQYEQLIFQVALARLKIELKALELWDRATRRIINELEDFASNLGNFVVRIGTEIKQIKLPVVSPSAIVADDPVYKKWQNPGSAWSRNRKAFIEELERLTNPRGANTLMGRLEDLGDWFIDAEKKAKKLKIPLEKVTDAYEAQLRALKDEALAPLIDFRDSLALGPSPTLESQFFSARGAFFDLAKLAQAGDLDAISQLAGAGQTYIELARQMFGSTARFDEIFQQVLDLVNSIIEGDAEDLTASNTQHSEVLDAFSASRELQSDLHSEAQGERRKTNNRLRDTVAKLSDIATSLERIEAA
jgi:hypothetical protein